MCEALCKNYRKEKTATQNLHEIGIENPGKADADFLLNVLPQFSTLKLNFVTARFLKALPKKYFFIHKGIFFYYQNKRWHCVQILHLQQERLDKFHVILFVG